MADVDINKFRASVVREGSKPASPGFIVSEGQSPTDPAGSGQNHLPVTIATAATGLSITDSQVLGGAGTTGQYIRGDGSLADFPSSSGGGSSVSYYLNGSVNQGTIGGIAYKELNKVPILGAGTDFTINANGYIASFITDAGDPNLLEIPGGNWNFETYFSASSSGGSPSFYVELYKVNSGGTATLIASNSTFPELIAFGTSIISYFSTLAVPTTTLALTDRLAIRYYVTHSGRTITLHTEDNHLCQIVTTFTTGITALNGLTAQVQNFAVGTSGTDFNIASATATHTFNLPTASATNRGALSSADWSMFNAKQNALTNPVTGTGSAGQIAYFTGTSAITSESGLTWDATNNNLSIGGATANSNLTVSGSDNTNIFTVLSGVNSRLHIGTATTGTLVYIRSQNNYGLNLGVNNTDYLTISNSGNSSFFGNITLANGANRFVRIGSASNYNYDLQTTGDDFQIIEAGATPRLTIKYPNGNVGINITTPATTLEVNGVGLFSGGSLVGNTKNGVYIYDQAIISLAGTNPRDLQIQAQNLRFFTGTTYGEKVRIFTDGNVLIQDGGTFTNNGARLQVSGRAYINNVGGSVAGATIYGNDQSNVRLRLENVNGRTWELTGGLTGANNSDFTIYDVTAAATRLTISSTGAATFSGDVTISKTSPTFRLTRGTTSASSLLVYNTNGTDNWLVGTGVTGSNTNYRIYNNGLGTDAIHIVNSNNNVLIGTQTDSGSNQPLQVVKAGSSNYLRLQADNNASYDCAHFFTDGTNSVYAGMMRGTSGLTGAFTIFTGGAVRLNATSNGNILIGTSTNGASRLRIVGLPTSAAGLSSGDVYNLSGVLMIA